MRSSKSIRLLSTREATKYISVSKRSIKCLIARGDLPYIGVGSSVRFIFSGLEAIIAATDQGDVRMTRIVPAQSAVTFGHVPSFKFLCYYQNSPSMKPPTQHKGLLLTARGKDIGVPGSRFFVS